MLAAETSVAAQRQHDGATPTSKLDFSKKTRRPRRLGRYETALRSFRRLRSLTPEKVSSFMDSYIIYGKFIQGESKEKGASHETRANVMSKTSTGPTKKR